MLAFLLVSKLFNPRVPRLFSDIRRFLLLWAQGAICHLCHEGLAVLYLQPCNNCNTNTQIRINKYKYTNTNTQKSEYTNTNTNTQVHTYNCMARYATNAMRDSPSCICRRATTARLLLHSVPIQKNGFTIFPLPCPNPIHCMTTVDRHSFDISQIRIHKYNCTAWQQLTGIVLQSHKSSRAPRCWGANRDLGWKSRKPEAYLQ